MPLQNYSLPGMDMSMVLATVRKPSSDCALRSARNARRIRSTRRTRAELMNVIARDIQERCCESDNRSSASTSIPGASSADPTINTSNTFQPLFLHAIINRLMNNLNMTTPPIRNLPEFPETRVQLHQDFHEEECEKNVVKDFEYTTIIEELYGRRQ